MRRNGIRPGIAGAVALVLASTACEGEAGRGRARPQSAELAAYCEVATRRDLDAWVGSLVTLCDTELVSDGPDAHEHVACRAGRVIAGGAIETLAMPVGVRRALPASRDRIVVLTEDERLVLASGDGAIERELAAWASDPWISEDGERVAWVGLPDGATTWELGEPTVILAQDLDDAAPALIADDALASTPRPVPGSSDVLYVSAQTGIASLWIAGPGRAPSQLTNAGEEEVGPATIPALDRQLAWAPGALFFAVPGEDAESAPRVWRVDLASGEASALGTGAWPRAMRDGTIATRHGDALPDCAAVYSQGGTP